MEALGLFRSRYDGHADPFPAAMVDRSETGVLTAATVIVPNTARSFKRLVNTIGNNLQSSTLFAGRSIPGGGA
jgi:hypothetical protein